jgi:uncharacterized protein DUF992
VHLRSCRWAALIALIFAQGMVPALAQQRRMEIGLLICGLTKSEETQSGVEPVAPGRQTWELDCSFRPTNGRPEETYTGTADSVGMEKELSEKRAMIWIVKRTGGTIGSTGQLEQVYAAELAANPGHSPPLIGEANGSLMLETLADARAAVPNGEKRITTAMIVLVNLILKSAPA